MTHREAAEYIASMLEGLHEVAKSAEMRFLAYLIDLAREEAKPEGESRLKDLSSKGRPRSLERDKLLTVTLEPAGQIELPA